MHSPLHTTTLHTAYLCIEGIKSQIEKEDNAKSKMAEEHVKIREQLSTFVAQYEKSEKEHAEHAGYVQKLIKTKGLEVQLAEARLAKQEQLTEAAKQHALIYQEECKALNLQQVDLCSKLKGSQETLVRCHAPTHASRAACPHSR